MGRSKRATSCLCSRFKRPGCLVRVPLAKIFSAEELDAIKVVYLGPSLSRPLLTQRPGDPGGTQDKSRRPVQTGVRSGARR
jgi:hypothetical protein